MQHLIDRMTDAVYAKLEPGCETRSQAEGLRETVREALTEFWAERIAVVWTKDDVKTIAPELSDKEAVDVLQEALHRHDASIGLNWDVLRELASDRAEDEEDDD